MIAITEILGEFYDTKSFDKLKRIKQEDLLAVCVLMLGEITAYLCKRDKIDYEGFKNIINSEV